jgi:hypothetical protein
MPGKIEIAPFLYADKVIAKSRTAAKTSHGSNSSGKRVVLTCTECAYSASMVPEILLSLDRLFSVPAPQRFLFHQKEKHTGDHQPDRGS